MASAAIISQTRTCPQFSLALTGDSLWIEQTLLNEPLRTLKLLSDGCGLLSGAYSLRLLPNKNAARTWQSLTPMAESLAPRASFFALLAR